MSEREHVRKLLSVRTWMSAATVAACLLAPRDRFGRQSARVAALQVALRAHGVYAGPGRRAHRPRHERGRAPHPAPRRTRRRRHRRPAHAPRARRPGPPPDRQPPAARRPPRLGRRRAAVRARDARLPVRRRSTAASARAPRAPSAAPQAFSGLDRRRHRRPGHARRALARAGPRPRAAQPDRGAARRPLRPARQPRSTPASTSPPPPAPRSPPPPPAASIFSGYDDGWGLTVVLDHGNGAPHPLRPPLRRTGQRSAPRCNAGTQVGRVGSTGHATGPHLHFEVTVRGANADPGLALGLY